MIRLLLQLCVLQQVAAGDTWDNYQSGGMDVTSVTGGSDKSNYDKVVIMLHGGGGSGSDWRYNYDQGWFGDLTGFKYVFPTSPISSHVWFNTYKNGCGLKDDCAYDIPSIRSSASAVATLIDHEKSLVGGDASKVYLAGFSEGAQLTGYMQLAKLDFALGGTIVMDGYPIPPLCDMPGSAQGDARKNATYYGTDMKWMIYWGAADPIFPASESRTAWHGIFDVLGVKSTLKIDHLEPGMSHTLIKDEFDQLLGFVGGKPGPAPGPSPPSPGPSPGGKGDYLCYGGTCYNKPGYGTMDKDTCERTCKQSGLVV
jgi:pimeloyl-ACP methyl ester carboxylesterase